MEARPGTYLLILTSPKQATISVGRIGEIVIRRGYYFYVGSAFGPGGVRARVHRHCRESARKHWHIDYFRDHMSVSGAIVSYDPERHEHRWAASLDALTDFSELTNIGCTDCDCSSHLYYCKYRPDFNVFRDHLPGSLDSWSNSNTA